MLQKPRAVAVARLHPPTSDLSATAGEDRDLGPTFRVQLEEGRDAVAAANALVAVAAVEAAEPNRWRKTTVEPDDPTFPGQWGLTAIDCPGAPGT